MQPKYKLHEGTNKRFYISLLILCILEHINCSIQIIHLYPGLFPFIIQLVPICMCDTVAEVPVVRSHAIRLNHNGFIKQCQITDR